MNRPLIGLTTYVEPVRHGDWDEEAAFCPTTYLASVDRSGGAPVLLPPSGADPAEVVGTLDGVVVIGGPDVDPSLYGAEPHRYTDPPRPARDAWESGVLRAALDADVPLLAICRGVQLLNVALGGTLYQHLEEVVGHSGHLSAVGQMSTTTVTVLPGSRLASILPEEATGLCHHHQAVDRLAGGLCVAATASDGTVEAVEVKGKAFAIGVQWHPEEDPADDRIVAALVVAARQRRACR